MKIMPLKAITCLLLFAALAAPGLSFSDENLANKAGRGIKKGGEAAGRGIEKGADATGKGVRKGVDATGRGLKKGGDWVGKKLNKVFK